MKTLLIALQLSVPHSYIQNIVESIIIPVHMNRTHGGNPIKKLYVINSKSEIDYYYDLDHTDVASVLEDYKADATLTLSMLNGYQEYNKIKEAMESYKNKDEVNMALED